MKKSIVLFIIILIFTSCSNKPNNMTNETFSIGKQALSILDEYLDGTKTAETAKNELWEAYGRLEALEPSNENDNVNYELMLSNILRAKIVANGIYLDTEIYTPEDIADARNGLAEKLGEKER